MNPSSSTDEFEEKNDTSAEYWTTYTKQLDERADELFDVIESFYDLLEPSESIADLIQTAITSLKGHNTQRATVLRTILNSHRAERYCRKVDNATYIQSLEHQAIRQAHIYKDRIAQLEREVQHQNTLIAILRPP